MRLTSASSRCPDDLLARSRRGALSEVERRLLDAHLGGCALCRTALTFGALCDEIPDRDDPEDAAVIVRLAARVAHGRARPRRPVRLVAYAAAVALFAVAGGAAAWVAVRRAAPDGDPTVPTGERPHNRSRDPGALAPPPAAVEAIVALAPPTSSPLAPASPLSRSALRGPAPSLPRTRPASHPVAPPLAPPRPAAEEAPQPLALPGEPALSASGPRDVERAPRATATSPPTAFVAPDGAAELLAAANAARRAGQWREAVSIYERLDARYPASAEATVSLVSAADLLLRLDAPARALAKVDRYLAGARGALAPEALFARARCLRALGRTADERDAWRTLDHAFPGSIYEATARRRLSELAP